MKKIKLTILFAALFTAGTFSATAQMGCGSGGGCKKSKNSSREDATQKYAQHGGTVSKVGKYHIEMVDQLVMAQNPVIYYLMDKKGNPITDKPVTGTASFTFSDGTTESSALTFLGENVYAVPEMQTKTKSFLSLVSFTINGENIMGRFEGGAPTQDAAVTKYSCPMHQGVISNKPGNCPKCGMALEKLK